MVSPYIYITYLYIHQYGYVREVRGIPARPDLREYILPKMGRESAEGRKDGHLRKIEASDDLAFDLLLTYLAWGSWWMRSKQ